MYLNVDADHSDIDFNLIIEAELYYGLTQTGAGQIKDIIKNNRIRVSDKEIIWVQNSVQVR